MYRAFAVQRHSQGVYYTSYDAFAYRYFYDRACRLDDVSLFNVSVRSEDYGTDVVLLEVLGHSICVLSELKQLACHAVLKTIYSGDTVTYLDYSTEIGNVQLTLIVLYLFFYDRTDFLRSQIHNLLSSLR